MMPVWVRYLCKRHPAPFARLAEAVFDVFDGSEEERAVEGIDLLEDFFRSVGAPTTLRELNIGEADIARLAANASARGNFGVLKSLDANDVLEIYKLAY